MFTKSDTHYLESKFVSRNEFYKAMDAIGMRFDQIEHSQEREYKILTSILKRFDKMEEDHSVLVHHGKRLDRLEKQLALG